jgi:hypothetical protein
MLQQKEIKMPRTVFMYVLLVSLLIASCGQSTALEPLNTPTTEAPASTLPAPGSEWTINMNHSGGIMGLMRSIEISSDGKFTVVDEKMDKTITGELSADELAKLNEEVLSSEYIPASKPNGMGCADCFLYNLEIYTNGKRAVIKLNDISLQGSGLQPLVNYLRGLMDTTLK